MIAPEGVDIDTAVEIERSVINGRTMVSVSVLGATILIETDPESVVYLPALIHGLPNILDRLYPLQEEA